MRAGVSLGVHPFVKELSPQRIGIFNPGLLDMYEGPLSLTVSHVLQTRQGEKVVLPIHFAASLSGRPDVGEDLVLYSLRNGALINCNLIVRKLTSRLFFGNGTTNSHRIKERMRWRIA